MQILFELFIIKKPEIVRTYLEAMTFMAVGAALSFIILNIASYVGLKWLVILAVIDLAYFVCWKVIGFAYIIIRYSAYFGLEEMWREFSCKEFCYVRKKYFN